MSQIHVRFTFGSRAAKVKKSEKPLKSVPDLQIPDKSSTFAANFICRCYETILTVGALCRYNDRNLACRTDILQRDANDHYAVAVFHERRYDLHDHYEDYRNV